MPNNEKKPPDIEAKDLKLLLAKANETDIATNTKPAKFKAREGIKDTEDDGLFDLD